MVTQGQAVLLRPEPLVAGIDSSLTDTGLVFSDGMMARHGKPGITGLSFDEKFHELRLLGKVISDPCVMRNADLVVIESLDVARSYGGLLERVILWYEIVTRLRRAHIPVLVAASSHRCTYATGKGSAKKNEIVDAVARRYPTFETHGNDNLADAVIFMALGRDFLGFPLADVPASHRLALTRVKYSVEEPPKKKVKTVRAKTVLSAE